jgi:hypothetical protein
VTTDNRTGMCAVCGYQQPADPCVVCGGEGMRLGKQAPLEIGRGNAFVDVFRGILDVRRAVFVMLFEREFIGKLRKPVAMNALGFGVLIVLGWSWLAPAFHSSFAGEPEPDASTHPNLWLMAVWLTAGPALLDLIAGWSQDPIRRATEQHMLGATLTKPPQSGMRLLDRLQMMLLIGMATLMGMALVLIPWVGIPATVLLGSAVAGVIWLQPPQAVRGARLRERLEVMWHNPWRTLGTGLALHIAAAVPFVNVLGLLPLATIAGTSAYLHFDKSTSHTTPPSKSKPESTA